MIDADTGCKGDGDPIDVCEIGTMVYILFVVFCDRDSLFKAG